MPSRPQQWRRDIKMKNLLIHRMLFGILTIASTISVWSLRLDAGTLTWAAKLRADQIFATSRGSTTYYSSTQLLVYWTAPGFPLDHYHLTIEELVAGTSTTSTFTSGTTSTFLENLKSSTGYLFTLKACLDAACSTYVDADSTAVGTTSQEVWQLRGTGNSFSTCDKVVSDGEVLSAAFRYGSSSLPGSKDGSYRMYYRPAQRPVGSEL